VDDLGDLGQLPVDVEIRVRRLRELALELTPEVTQRLEVGVGGAADVHPGMRRPTSR
jgi:hypothetical protein